MIPNPEPYGYTTRVHKDWHFNIVGLPNYKAERSTTVLEIAVKRVKENVGNNVSKNTPY